LDVEKRVPEKIGIQQAAAGCSPLAGQEMKKPDRKKTSHQSDA
jgi:hypothetical protein